MPLISFAQSNFVDGYIIKLNGDTVKGKLDDRNWNITPKQITFRDSSVHSFNANEIAGFGSSSDHYRSFNLKLNLTNENLRSNIKTEEGQTVKDTTLFLRFLIEGDQRLYAFMDKDDVAHFFIINNQNAATELIHYRRLVVVNNVQYVQEVNTYRDQLLDLLNPDNKLTWKIKRSNYYEDELIQIFEVYNRSKGIVKAEKVTKRKEKFIDYYLIAGITSAQTSYYLESIYGNFDYKLGNSLTPSVGASLTVYIPRNRMQFSLDNQLLFVSYNMESEKYKSPYSNSNTFVRSSSSYIKMFNIFKYQYPKGLIRPYIGAGISFAARLASKSEFNIIYPLGSSETYRAVYGNKKFEPGYAFLLGTAYKRYKLEFRNDYAINSLNSTTYYQLNLCYRLR
ncbi:hypothetical protein C3K47_13705 [Solitalea longa]|uniref:Outer membrane protein beta-barrel domain-containing protein n=1 Tax=Solitalea longa TaxID=2079460 RepID=A0A2S5A0M4_9SPHI|nr:hypothetical protein C3K47_13705 [Solitalea longa]